MEIYYEIILKGRGSVMVKTIEHLDLFLREKHLTWGDIAYVRKWEKDGNTMKAIPIRR